MAMTDNQLRNLSADELVTIIIEEASETIQAACKAVRFGLDGFHPDEPDVNNLLLLCREAEQTGSAARILGAKFGIKYGDIVDARTLADTKKTPTPIKEPGL